ncbi:MAG: 2,5-diamino-6-(ribosylamino)-4(3H)-pyrimidinone 5'-phosphate reductase [Candidatus Thermoplasmatota archaeon]
MQRPYIIINCAMSADGKTALPNGKQLRLSCEEDLKRMYELRHSCDAVLVGINTVLTDDPKLTVKETYVKNPRQPLRVILDSTCRIPSTALVLNDAAPTMIVTTKGYEKKFPGKHVDVVGCPADVEGNVDLAYLLQILVDRGIHKLLVEGGGTVIWSFLNHRFMDDMYVYIAPLVVGGKKTPTLVHGAGITQHQEAVVLKLQSVKTLGPGILVHYTFA